MSVTMITTKIMAACNRIAVEVAVAKICFLGTAADEQYWSKYS